ncbi:hypothetical protein A3A64_00960 [Candidatus Gottesmanbacteria bacterium RIFCSPLOWO2_01_FULL_48_11]|nr:MAG: hypothetical protein A3A64_00960 [Candidatus Gottesmanbacteria bacterium RIFCSPLOWO2_01_FULL_48_11]
MTYCMNTVILIFLGVLSRVVPHPANVTAVGGLAIFSGARLEFKKAIVVTLVTMFLSDIILGFHSVMWATYGSLGLAVMLGRFLQKRSSIKQIVTLTFVSSLLFYLITNFAVWAIPGSMYPKTLSGLLQSYIMALPFFRNSLLGDMGYSFIFFGAYEFVKMYKNIFVKKTYVKNSF